jgi:ABC-type antimicrobial peptide transport system permease subunit
VPCAGQFGQLTSSWFNVVNQVGQSEQIRTLSKTAATSSAVHGEPTTSVMSLYEHMQNQVGPISPSSTSIGVLATAAIGSGNHWTPAMNTTLILTAPLLGVAVGVLAGSYPAIRAARITPMAALRS